MITDSVLEKYKTRTKLYLLRVMHGLYQVEPPGHTMTLVSTQPLTEMITRNIS
jgi:hypothetical protein